MKEPDGIYFPQGNTIHAALYDFHQTPTIDNDLLLSMADSIGRMKIEEGILRFQRKPSDGRTD